MSLLISLIDADANLNSHLAAELSLRGFRVEPAADSSDVMSKKDDLPQLIVLCIDPKRTGWAICNRLRKSPTLKAVPLIITSAEATEKDFDDHKKLKTRAEEYLHKPFSPATLVEKIGYLIGLPETGAEADLELPIEEVAIEPSGLLMLEDLEPVMARATAPADLGGFGEDGDDEHTRVGTFNQIDGEVDLETHAAFASIGVDELAEPSSFSAPSPAAASLFAPPPALEEDPFHVSAESPADVAADPFSSAPVLDDLDLGLDDVAAQAAASPARSQAAKEKEPSVDTSLALSRENEQLRRELEDLRNRLQTKSDAAPTSGFSREREFLNLREVINKKEKEVLDLRDALDSKERQILDGKDKLRELERKYRDLDEKVLSTEKELVSAREKIEALATDKEKVVEREKQVKARLEDSQRALQRSEEELESCKAQIAADAVAHQKTVRELEETHAANLAEEQARHASEAQAAQHRLETMHAQQMAQLREASTHEKEGLRLRFEQQLADLEGQHQAETNAASEQHAAMIAQLQEEHAAVLAQKEQTQADELAGIRARVAADLKATERKHAEAEEVLKEQHGAQLQAVEEQRLEELAQKAEEHRLEIEQLVQEHAAERAGLERDHETAVQALDERRQKELREFGAQSVRDQEMALEAQKAQHDEELRVQRESHQRKMQVLEESHEDLKAGMQARHAANVDEITKKHFDEIAAFQAAVAERDGALAELEKRVSELEEGLVSEQRQNRALSQQFGEAEERIQTIHGELAARTQQMSEQTQRISELETESAGYQDQILKAYQRIKSDENIVSRAKKALAIALTLLEENAPESSEDVVS